MKPYPEHCMKSLLRYADILWESVKKKQINESCVEGLIDSFLQQSAYSNTNKVVLKKMALNRK